MDIMDRVRESISAVSKFCFCAAAITKNIREIIKVNADVSPGRMDVNLIEFTIRRSHRVVSNIELKVLKYIYVPFGVVIKLILIFEIYSMAMIPIHKREFFINFLSNFRFQNIVEPSINNIKKEEVIIPMDNCKFFPSVSNAIETISQKKRGIYFNLLSLLSLLKMNRDVIIEKIEINTYFTSTMAIPLNLVF